MKNSIIILLVISMLFMFSMISTAETEIRIVGFGGIDKSIVEELITLFVVPELAGTGITAIYDQL